MRGLSPARHALQAAGDKRSPQSGGGSGVREVPPNCRAVFGNSAPTPGQDFLYLVLPRCCPNARQSPPSGQIKAAALRASRLRRRIQEGCGGGKVTIARLRLILFLAQIYDLKGSTHENGSKKPWMNENEEDRKDGFYSAGRRDAHRDYFSRS